ncbi:MAG: putative ABC transporter permease [Peptoniphilus sp.]|uniref:putative ABC transporter permease n=1 Tax=Peptoniphilus sp. TaxID=1971214 RepID=UPI00399A2091
MRDYIIYFFIYAFIGWVVEVSYHAVTKGKFINRGFLAGPYCPIYGFGAIAVIYLLTDIAAKEQVGLVPWLNVNSDSNRIRGRLLA